MAPLRATARLVDTDKLPTAQITVRIDLRAQPQQHWMLLHRPQAEACIRYPRHSLKSSSSTPPPTRSGAGPYANS